MGKVLCGREPATALERTPKRGCSSALPVTSFPTWPLGQFSISLSSLSLFLCFYIYLEIIFTIMCHQLCNPLINLHTCELVSTSFVQKCHKPARAHLSSLHSRIFWERSLSLSPSEAVPLSFKKFKILSIIKKEALKSHH